MNSRCFKIHRSYSIVVQFVKGWWIFLALHENSFIFCTNQFPLPRNDCENLKMVSKASVKKWKRIPVLNVPTGKTGLPRQTFHCSGKFSTETSQSDCKDPTSDCKINEINDDIFSLGKFNLSYLFSLCRKVISFMQCVRIPTLLYHHLTWATPRIKSFKWWLDITICTASQRYD